jgi:hypothetical protein
MAPLQGQTSWTDETLDRLRRAGDPEADMLWDMFGEPRFQRLAFTFVRERITNSQPVPASYPVELRRFLEQTARLPEWADLQRIGRAQELFSRFGPQMVTALFCASLPECYAAVRGANILYLSPRMRTDPFHRIMETAQFVLDVMAPGGLGPDGRGVRTAQKVRLIHIYNRHVLPRAGAGEQRYRPEWGLPLNQEDLLGTLMSFVPVVLDSLKKLGIDFTEQEEEDYLHAWLVVGALLGIDEGQFPRDMRAARALADCERRRHFGRSQAGVELARALVGFLKQAMPGEIFDGFICVLMRYLMGPEVAGLLDIPEDDWTVIFLRVARFIDDVYDDLGDHVGAFARAGAFLGRKTLEAAYLVYTGGQPMPLHIPAPLMKKWGLHQHRPAPAVAACAAAAPVAVAG